MQATAIRLEQLFGGDKQFTMPIFQRPYSWKVEHCKTLFEDILRIGQIQGAYKHFIGCVVYLEDGINGSGIQKYRVIDGQQRLTTISLLVAALLDFYNNQNLENRDALNNTGFYDVPLLNRYLENNGYGPVTQYKLELTPPDNTDFITLLASITSRAVYAGNSQSAVKTNYDYFKSVVTINNVMDIHNGLTNLHIVNVMLDKNDNPQLIFESLNSTGLDLTQADLIRNFVLMGLTGDEQIFLYTSYWLPMESSFGNHYEKSFNSFVRDYLTVKTGYISKVNAVYKDFKHYAHGQIIQTLMKDICDFSGYYINIALDKEPDINLKNAFKRISQLDVRACYPFLLKVYDDYKNNQVNAVDFNEIVCLVENYIFRRSICGLPSNSLNKIFADLYGQADPINGTNYLQSIKNAFSNLKDNKRFPNDEEFKFSFIIKDVYNLSSCRYLLERLENSYPGRKKEPVVINSVITIEHIMPQTLEDEWKTMLGNNWQTVHNQYLHTIGNLTLTGYNIELSNNPFDYKKTCEGGFNNSIFKLNEFVQKQTSWTEDKIKDRAEDLGNCAVKIWFAP